MQINKLNKSFGGNHVIRDLDLEVSENCIFGFLGQNGAGKTTTMKMVTGLLKADSGDISICGQRVSYGDTKTNRDIGYLPDIPEFYGYMKPKEYLKLSGEISGMPKDKIRERTHQLLSLVGLDNADRKISGFSRGMKQRLGIAHALLNEPKLLICDEPTSALDPMGRKEILDILASIKNETTVVFSTHILSDVERICDHVAVLHSGKIVLNGSLSQLRQRYSHDSIEIDFFNEEDIDMFLSNEELSSKLKEINRNRNKVTVKVPDIKEGGQYIMAVLSKMSIMPASLVVKEPSLESLFLEVVK